MPGLNALSASLILLSATTYACGAPPSGSQPAGIASVNLSDMFAVYERAVGSPLYTSAVAKLNSSAIVAGYNEVLRTTTNASFDIGSHRFHNLKDLLNNLGPQQKANGKIFGSYGNFWKSLGVNTQDKVSLAEYNDGLAVYERLATANADSVSITLTNDDAATLAKAQMVGVALSLPPAAASELMLVESGGSATQPPTFGGQTFNPPQVTINGGTTDYFNCHDRINTLVSVNDTTICGRPPISTPPAPAPFTIPAGTSTFSTQPQPQPRP